MDVQERKRIARRMVDDGATLKEIAKRLGYKSVAPAGRIVNQVLKEMGEAPEPETKPDAPRPAAPPANGMTELERLDAMLNALWPAALEGQVGAIDRVMKIEERRAQLGAAPAAAPTTDDKPAGEVTPVASFLSRLSERSANVQGRAAG